jgi:anaerobic selenocysteine-containing dehydrogenase
VHHGLYQNETAELCQWHVSATHELEAWGDARAYDGTVSIIQPLIAPLYNGKSALEFVALLSGQADATGYDLSAPTGRSSTPARTSSSSGASRCTTAGSKAQRLRQGR